MAYPLEPPVAPMLAKLTAEIPRDEGWIFEPKWDGFRGVVYRDGDDLIVLSRNGRPLGRYFPEVVEALGEALPQRCVVDGEIIMPFGDVLDFDRLQLRLHPAASRVRKLAAESPASYVAFDVLALEDDAMGAPFAERRRMLERAVREGERVFLTPLTRDPDLAARWFTEFEGAGLDGVIAKREDLPYRPGERVMAKIKHGRTADCVVAGYRRHASGDGVGSLLLGLYEESGALRFVGFAASFRAAVRRELAETLRPYEDGDGFTEGYGPGGSRWSGGKEADWVRLRPELVCEVAFDYLQGPRFRHGTRFLRWRPDKDPSDCTFDQLEPPGRFSLDRVRRLSGGDASS